MVGENDGDPEGVPVGCPLGIVDGLADGDPEGVPVGSPLGFTYVSKGGYVVMRRYVQRRYTGSLTV